METLMFYSVVVLLVSCAIMAVGAVFFMVKIALDW